MSAYAFTASAFIIASLIVWAPEWIAALRGFLRAVDPPETNRAERAFRLPAPLRDAPRRDEDPLLHPDPELRRRSFEGLATLPDGEAVDRLLPLLPRVPETDRKAWVDFLLGLDDERVAPALHRWLGLAEIDLAPSPRPADGEDAPAKVVDLFRAYGSRNRRIRSEVARLMRADRLGLTSSMDEGLLRERRESDGPAEIVPLALVRRRSAATSPFDRARRLAETSRKRGDHALGEIVGSLRGDESPYVRAVAASLLRGRRDAEARRALVESIRDPHENVRWSAVQVLARWDDPAVAPSLRELRDGDPSEAVRQAAQRALRRLAS